jgi:hypothetical protein
MTKMAADVSSAHEALLKEREALNNLQVGCLLGGERWLCCALNWRGPHSGRPWVRVAFQTATRPYLNSPTSQPPPTAADPQDQHAQLLRAQEVLQAELSMALGSYQPKATIDAGTPADKLLAMMTELLDGALPNLQDILLIQSTILEVRSRLAGSFRVVKATLVFALGRSRFGGLAGSASGIHTPPHTQQKPNPTQPNATNRQPPNRPATSTSRSAWASS